MEVDGDGWRLMVFGEKTKGTFFHLCLMVGCSLVGVHFLPVNLSQIAAAAAAAAAVCHETCISFLTVNININIRTSIPSKPT